MGRPHLERLSPPSGRKWGSCVLCHDSFRTLVELKFENGSVEPTYGETITGVTSGHTGVVDSSMTISGTYAGGDAVGYIMLTNPSGIDGDSGDCFEDGENLSGSVGGGSFATADGAGIAKSYGVRLHPREGLIPFRGKTYCQCHFNKRWNKKLEDEAKFKLDEGDRNKNV